MNDRTLLDRANMDYLTATVMLNHELVDELQYDIVAYHVQQTLEKCLKFVMQQNGVEFLLGHEIDKLCDQMGDNDLVVDEWIWENSDVLTRYATKTRYSEGLVATKRKLIELHQKVGDYLENLLKEYVVPQHRLQEEGH